MWKNNKIGTCILNHKKISRKIRQLNLENDKVLT